MPLRNNYTADFERFWAAYPRQGKVSKGAAFKAFEKLKLTSEEVDELVLYLERRKRDDVKWVEGKYIPHATSFLNQHRWEDEYQRIRQHWTQREKPQQAKPEEVVRRADPADVRRMLKETGLLH